MNRIQYIDAMRGFTMFLVVWGHISLFSLGDTESFHYHQFFAPIQMPLFFFISGFLFYKSKYNYTLFDSIKLLYSKTNVLILSPFLFMLVSLYTRHLDFNVALFDSFKAGYWFTFALFQCFCLYVLIQLFVRKVKIKGLYEDGFLLIIGFLIYNVTILPIVNKYHIDKGWTSLVGFSQWHDFIFFLFALEFANILGYLRNGLIIDTLVYAL